MNKSGSAGMLSTPSPSEVRHEAASLFSSPHASMKLSTSPMVPLFPHATAPSSSTPPGTPSRAQPAGLQLMQLLKVNAPGENHARARSPPPSPNALEPSLKNQTRSAATTSIASALEERLTRQPESPHRAYPSQPSTPQQFSSSIHPPGAVTQASLEARMKMQANMASLAAKQQPSVGVIGSSRWNRNKSSGLADDSPQSLKGVLSKFSAPPEEPQTCASPTFLRDPVILQRVAGESKPVPIQAAVTSSEAAVSSLETSTSASREAEIADRRKKGTKIRN